VPASEKLVSLFEPHADIIVKDARDVQYGHKLNLVTGRSGLILDVVIEAGNPADAERFLPMLERQIARCGVPPRQIAADGGYASQDNLTAAKARGVKDVAFHKKHGLAVEDMAKSRWVHRIASCATSAPGSRPGSPASSEPTVGTLHPGAGLITYIWSAVVATTWCCSPVSNRHSLRARPQLR
jgi:IS5 family transposase